MNYCRENIFNYWSCCPSINLSNYVTKDELEEALSGISGCDLTEIEETLESMQDDIEENGANIEALQGIISSLTDRVSTLENLVPQKANISDLEATEQALAQAINIIKQELANKADSSAITEIWDAIEEISGDTPTPIDYLTFNAVTDGTFSFSNPLEYSLDNGNTWIELAANTATPTVTSGNSIKFKADLVANTNGIGRFSSTGQFEAMGNPMSLVSGDNISVYQFRSLFSGCTGLTSAEHLILNKNVLNEYCYQSMFNRCTSLTTAPELPATKLANGCYSQMFTNCSSLTTAPELPATTLASNCYYDMFAGCTSLTTAPELPATTLVQGCYTQMFINCSSLTTAPQLPATTLANYSYQGMFYGCSSLNYIKCLATDISAVWVTQNWVYGVASTGTFVKNKDMNDWAINSTSGVPIGWTVIDDGVEPTPTPTSKKLVVTVNNKPNYELDCDDDDYLDSTQTKPNNDYLSYLTAEVGDCITEIGNAAFQYCRNLTAVTLPSTIEVIHNFAFSTGIYGEPTNHLDIYINAVTPPTLDQDSVGSDSFFASDSTIYVPAASVNAYKAAWPTYADKIENME